MSNTKLRIATRKSPLALWQANFIKDKLREKWPDLEIELLPMVTSGDRFLKDKLQEKGGKGLFVKELETALLNHKADIAVHSMKDVPAVLPEGLMIDTYYKRDNPFDALISPKNLSLEKLPLNSVIGTSSLRRQAQLLRYRPDLKIKLLRGNINTRLEKLDQGEYDAIILAASGLMRMGFNERISEIIPADIMLPACAQGGLGIECRIDDERTRTYLAPLHDAQTALCISAEREVNRLLGGHCHVPVAIFCKPLDENLMKIRARVLNPNGNLMLESEQLGLKENVPALAAQIAHDLIAQGGLELLQQHG